MTIEPLNDSDTITLTLDELLDALIQAHAGIQPATVLVQVTYRYTQRTQTPTP